MPRYKLIVMTEPTEGREADYNEWYQNVHLDDVVAIPGIASARRYKLAAVVGAERPFPYLAIYDIETDNPDAVLADIAARGGTDKMQLSDALSQNMHVVLYEEFGAPVSG